MNLGEPDYAFDVDEVSLIVGRMWHWAAPGHLLVATWDKVICQGEKEYRFGALLTRITKSQDREAWDRDREFLEWLKPRLERHPGFMALQRRMGAIGIEGGYHGFGEYVGSATLYQYSVREEHLPALEETAQDEMGLVTPEARAEAAAKFRIYMRRNFGERLEEERKTLPPIDVSPYALRPLEERWEREGSIRPSDWLP